MTSKMVSHSSACRPWVTRCPGSSTAASSTPRARSGSVYRPSRIRVQRPETSRASMPFAVHCARCPTRSSIIGRRRPAPSTPSTGPCTHVRSSSSYRPPTAVSRSTIDTSATRSTMRLLACATRSSPSSPVVRPSGSGSATTTAAGGSSMTPRERGVVAGATWRRAAIAPRRRATARSRRRVRRATAPRRPPSTPERQYRVATEPTETGPALQRKPVVFAQGRDRVVEPEEALDHAEQVDTPDMSFGERRHPRLDIGSPERDICPTFVLESVGNVFAGEHDDGVRPEWLGECCPTARSQDPSELTGAGHRVEVVQDGLADSDVEGAVLERQLLTGGHGERGAVLEAVQL